LIRLINFARAGSVASNRFGGWLAAEPLTSLELRLASTVPGVPGDGGQCNIHVEGERGLSRLIKLEEPR